MSEIDLYDPEGYYDGVAALYAAAARDLFPFAHERLVELARPVPGDDVLDVACGPGPISHRAARRVAPGGWVLGVDISRAMLRVATQQAAAEQLDAGFFRANFHALPFAPETFDRVLCGFALFFAKDVTELVRRLWALVKPGGTLALSTLTDFLRPLFDEYLRALPASVDATPFLVGRRTESADALEAIVAEAGVPGADVTHETRKIALQDMGTWWQLVDSTGVGRIHAELDPAQADAVRSQVDAYAAAHRVTAVDLGVNYVIARKSPRAE
jgi:ubiquinone/menaquinone biosynthesis C-methylase UbiE